MNEDLQKCLNVLFRQKGKEIMSEKEFVYTVSMDLRWFSPRDAQRLLDKSLKNGLLKLSHGMLAPAFELSDEHVGLDYRPSKDMIKSATKPQKKDLFVELVKKISSAKKLKKREVVARINKMQEQIPVEIEVAALLIAKELGIDVSDEVAEVEREIMTRGR